MAKPLVLFVTGADCPVVAPGTTPEKRLEVNVAYRVSQLVGQCDRDDLPMLASFLLDSTVAVLVGAGVSKGVALKWLEKVAPEAYDFVAPKGPERPEVGAA
jgi:hypothetical protein